MKASYIYVGSNDTTVYIADLDIGMSVTNDADAVVARLLPKIKGKRIVYKDTEGRWDELIHDGNKFIDFGPASEPTGLLD